MCATKEKGGKRLKKKKKKFDGGLSGVERGEWHDRRAVTRKDGQRNPSIL